MKHVYIVTYNDHVSTEGYDSFDKAVTFIKERHNIESFEAVTSMHYTDGVDSYKIHQVKIL